MQAIIYDNGLGGVSIVWPTKNAIDNIGINEIALKDVPYNKPFKIVSVEELPLDGTFNENGIPNVDKEFRDLWSIDEADLMDGVGLGHNRWTFKELEKELLEVQSWQFEPLPKGENTSEELSNDDFELAYQNYLVESKNEFDQNKYNALANIEAKIQALQTLIALES